MVIDSTPGDFNLSLGGTGSSKKVASRDGVAWTNSNSASKAGAAQFVASVGDAEVKRVVQQVAADPCHLTMRVAGRTANRIIVETAPIRDCSGNPVPDGTMVRLLVN